MIVIGDQQWLWPAVLMAAAALGVLAWSYRWTAGRRGVRVACAALKAAAFVLLAVFLFEPLWSGVRARPGANLFLLVADNSRSLEIRDAGEAHSRGEALKALLSDRGADWPARLEQDFDVRRYRFDRGLAQCDEFEELDFTGNASSIHGTLAAIAERFRGRPVAGVLLFTDGNATDAGRSFDGLALPPIHPVPVGSTASRPDLAIAHVAVSQTAFEDAPVTIQAAVSASGLAGRSVAARLLDEDGKPVAESTQTIAAGVDRESLAFRFQLRPPGDGVSFYTLDVESVSDSLHESSRPLAAQGDHNGSPTDESTLKNNRRVVQVDRGAGRKRILYVSGRPNWEFKFLRRAIEDDPGVELAALIRIATREAKFDFRGRAGESSNPLFRGFKQDADAETESYDEPVLVRLNMRDGDELRGGFPKSARELFGFHAVVLDDLEAAFFTPDQLDLLEEFVSERGGGLLMLGGQESFARGGYEHTPVARLLPVYLDAPARRTEFHSVRQNVIDPLRESKRPLAERVDYVDGRSGTPSYAAGSTGYRMLLSREGWLQPWTRLRANEADERRRLEDMPAFRTINETSGIKPGAAVLAEAIDHAGNSLPALVTQRYGHGRTAALTIGDLWRWQLKQPEGSDDAGKAWRQALRWLVADVPEPVTIEVRPAADTSSETVLLRVKALDRSFQPLDNASVSLTVHPPAPGGQPLTLHAEPSLDEPGVFEAAYVPREPGACRVLATVTDENGQAAGTAETGWVSNPTADEFRSVTPDRAFVERLARETGGQLVEPHDLGRFVASLSTRDAPVTERWTYPLWHQAWVFIVAVACLAGEWGLRRAKGMP